MVEVVKKMSSNLCFIRNEQNYNGNETLVNSLELIRLDFKDIDALESIQLNVKDIDERTDKILELTHSTRIEREIDQIWDSVMDLVYTATCEIERLRNNTE